jgi:transposase-like protein
MITMNTKQEIIRRYFRENDSERKISRDLEINRGTVKKYLKEYIEAKKKSEREGTTEALQEYSSSAPAYNSRSSILAP